MERTAEPEEADGEADGADDHGRETLFRDAFAVFVEGACEVCGGAVGDYGGAEDDAHDEGGKGELGGAEGPAALFVVSYGVLRHVR